MVAIVAGCGARTGLSAPDGSTREPPDAGLDAETPRTCVVVPPDAGLVRASMTLPVSLRVVDIVFLLDATGSMIDEIENIRSRLRSRVVPGVREAISDAAFAVAYLGEFPVSPHGPADVRPYELRAPITLDVLQVEAALSATPLWGNFDEPEAQVEALYQVATGAGLEPFIPPSAGCPSGGTGGVCFRREALPVVMLATDAPFQNGPPGLPPESHYSFEPAPREYDEAVSALRDLGALVLGLGATDLGSLSPLPHLRALALDTGSVDGAGDPLVFDIGSRGGRLGDGIVSAVERLAADVPLDVTAQVFDVEGDAVDARTLVRRVRPLRADPPDQVRTITETAFVGVLPGTVVTFELELDASSLPPSDVTRRIPARVLFRAFERTPIGEVDVLIVVPGAAGADCDAGAPP